MPPIIIPMMLFYLFSTTIGLSLSFGPSSLSKSSNSFWQNYSGGYCDIFLDNTLPKANSYRTRLYLTQYVPYLNGIGTELQYFRKVGHSGLFKFTRVHNQINGNNIPSTLFRPIFGIPLCLFGDFFLFTGFGGSCLVRFFLSSFFF